MTKSTTIPQDAVIADIQKSKTGAWRVRVYWFAGVITGLVFMLAIVAGWHIVLTVAPYVLVIIAIVTLGFVGWLFYELFQNSKTRHKTHNAERRIIEAEARAKEAQARALEFFTYSRTEGVIRHNDNGLDVLALPLPNVDNSLTMYGQNNSFDFFELMTQIKKAYAIFGRQQVGKSTIAHHLARFWQDKGIQPVVIGQKFDSHEYTAGVMRFGPTEESIIDGFNLIRSEAQERQRLAQQGQAFSDMSALPVIIEDATSLNSIVEAKEYEHFMRQLLTVYAARLIVVYLVVHGMDIASFGLKAGSALKNQLTCLYFDVPPNKAAFNMSDVTITASVQYEPKAENRFPVVNIPYGYATLTDDCSPALYSLAVDVPKPKQTMTKQEQKILRLYGNGWAVSRIAEHLYDTASKHNNDKIKDVLIKWGVEVKDARLREVEL